MSYKQQAEELVRERVPELKGVDSGRPTGSGYIDYPEIKHNHWLIVLGKLFNFRSITYYIKDDIWEVNLRKNVDGIEFVHMNFSLITGQPSTEEDYQKIVELIK